MSVTLLREVPTNRLGEELIESADAGLTKVESRFHRQFIAQTDDANDGPATVLADTALPALNSTYTFSQAEPERALADN